MDWLLANFDALSKAASALGVVLLLGMFIVMTAMALYRQWVVMGWMYREKVSEIAALKILLTQALAEHANLLADLTDTRRPPDDRTETPRRRR